MPGPKKDDSSASSQDQAQSVPAAADTSKTDSNTPLSSADLSSAVLPKEVGGQKGPEPTRYGDWEKNGRCTDF